MNNKLFYSVKKNTKYSKKNIDKSIFITFKKNYNSNSIIKNIRNKNTKIINNI